MRDPIPGTRVSGKSPRSIAIRAKLLKTLRCPKIAHGHLPNTDWALGPIIAKPQIDLMFSSLGAAEMLSLRRETGLGILVLLWFCPVGCMKIEGDPPASTPNRLKQLGLALHQYHDHYGAFPPVITTDKHGRPMHSWRVLILPFLDRRDLYEEYDLSHAWDSAINRNLISRIPAPFQCPCNCDNAEGRTAFLAVVGEDAAWEKSKSRRRGEFSDGLDNTVIIVELPSQSVPWTKPNDVSFPFVALCLDDGTRLNCLFGDARVRSMKTSDLEQLLPAFTISRGDSFDRSLLHPSVNHSY